jgi:PTH1 family peptidyl-tRNA hydrolase
MKLIIGLGNPGEKYKQTRHNMGFVVLDQLANELESKGTWKKDTKRKSCVRNVSYHHCSIVLAKPQTFMNKSGDATASLIAYYNVSLPDVIVVHDDIDLPFGKLRIKSGGGSGGHNGLASIIASVGSEEFIRVRVGIGKEEWFRSGEIHKTYDDAADYVLDRCCRRERERLPEIVTVCVQALVTILNDGVASAMNSFNG